MELYKRTGEYMYKNVHDTKILECLNCKAERRERIQYFRKYCSKFVVALVRMTFVFCFPVA